MAFNVKLILSICTIAIIMTHVAAILPKEEIDGFINEHNIARAKVGNGPLKWNKTIADYDPSYQDDERPY
ncbi:hypothetical protein ACFXTH_003302 [Malus domestica]